MSNVEGFLSSLVIDNIVAINRVNRALGSYTVKDRPHCALCYKVSGRSGYVQNKTEIASDENRIVFIPKGAFYRYTCYEAGECVILDFSAKNPGNKLMSFEISNKAEILSLFDRIERSHRFKEYGYKLYCLSGLYHIMYSMEHHLDVQVGANRKKKKIQKGITYLEDNFRKTNLTIKEVAEVSNVSEIYFRKLFTEIYGIPPKTYISLMRMKKAKELLSTHEVSIQQIAEEVGFNDVYSFCKAFKKAQHCTPTEYMKAH